MQQVDRTGEPNTASSRPAAKSSGGRLMPDPLGQEGSKRRARECSLTLSLKVYECVAHAVGFAGRRLWCEKAPLFSFFFFSVVGVPCFLVATSIRGGKD